MPLRPKYQLARLCTAFMAVVGILLFAFAAPSTHPLMLHTVSAEASSSTDSFSHSGHSHDNDDLADDDGAENDHHHADHTHEKAGLPTANGAPLRTSIFAAFSPFSLNLVGDFPDGIDRPPRHSSLI